MAAGTLHAAMCFQDAEAEPRRPEGTERHELGGEAMLAVLPPDHALAGRQRLAAARAGRRYLEAPPRAST